MLRTVFPSIIRSLRLYIQHQANVIQVSANCLLAGSWQNQPDEQYLKLFYFGSTFYMLRTVFPSIIRSLRLYIQHQANVIQVSVNCLLAGSWQNQPDEQYLKLFYFGSAFYMLRTVFPSIIRSLRLYIQHQANVKQVSANCLLAGSWQNQPDE